MKGSMKTGWALVMLALALAARPAAAEDPGLAEAGKRQWVRCSGCHSLSADAPPMFGPHLEGIVGRTAGTVEGYEYTDPRLRAREFTWDEAYFDEWLADPRAKYPEMCLAFHGLMNPETRRALIAFLKQPVP
mgnify:CR=1 FL=1